MRGIRIAGLFAIAIPAIGLLGCAYPIARQYRQEARKDLTFPMVLKDPETCKGAVVIWGGTVAQANYTSVGTELLMLEGALDFAGAPAERRFSRGRYLAKTPQFLDPDVYVKGAQITLAGEIVGKETRPLDKGEYTYPVLTIKQIHLWPNKAYLSPPPYAGWDTWQTPRYWPYF